MACHRKGVVSSLQGMVGVLQWVLVSQGVFTDWEAIDCDNSLQGVFFPDLGIKTSIKWALGMNNICKRERVHNIVNNILKL